MECFTPLRNGLSEHIKDGRLGPYDLGVYSFLHLHADWATGVYKGCALTIAFGFGDPSIKEHIQKSLRRLRDRGYINYRKGDGARGAYPILINKYEPRVGELLGTRLNAWKHGELAKPDYEPKNGHGTVVALSRNSEGTVVAPIQEVKEVKEEKTTTPLQWSGNSSPQVAQKKTRRTKAAILSVYPQTVSDVVNDVCSKWPKRQPGDGKEIRNDVSQLAARVDQILRDNPDVTPNLLTGAAGRYLGEQKRFYRAPQYFFGPGNGTEAPWVDYARMIVHQASKSQTAEAVQ
jgi:hypothetical protein